MSGFARGHGDSCPKGAGVRGPLTIKYKSLQKKRLLLIVYLALLHKPLQKQRVDFRDAYPR
jgi:hypothetical protein